MLSMDTYVKYQYLSRHFSPTLTPPWRVVASPKSPYDLFTTSSRSSQNCISWHPESVWISCISQLPILDNEKGTKFINEEAFKECSAFKHIKNPTKALVINRINGGSYKCRFVNKRVLFVAHRRETPWHRWSSLPKHQSGDYVLWGQFWHKKARCTPTDSIVTPTNVA